MHFDLITKIVHDDALLAQLYAICNIGELIITVGLFYVASIAQRMDGDIYKNLIDLHFNKLTEHEAHDAIFSKSAKQKRLEYIEVAGFIILMISQVFTTWYILTP